MPRLNIQKEGLIKGGDVDYSVHSDGRIEYAGTIKIKMGFFSKTHNFSGTYFAGSEAVLSKSYDQEGETQVIEGIEGKVQETDGKKFSKVHVQHPEVHGFIWGDISQKIISVTKVILNGKVMGRNIKLKAW